MRRSGVLACKKQEASSIYPFFAFSRYFVLKQPKDKCPSNVARLVLHSLDVSVILWDEVYIDN
jgi:hypothetical protein